jgi:hypothetical protein
MFRSGDPGAVADITRKHGSVGAIDGPGEQVGTSPQGIQNLGDAARIVEVERAEADIADHPCLGFQAAADFPTEPGDRKEGKGD